MLGANRRQAFELSSFSPKEEEELWDRMARGSEVINGWTSGCMRLVNSDKTRTNFQTLCSQLSQQDIKVLRLLSFFTMKESKEGEFVYIFNEDKSLLHEKMAAIEVLRCENKDYIGWVMVHNKTFDYWARLSFEFDCYAFGITGNKECIGEKDKSKRICRFCGLPNKTYGSDAHAISHALGNNILFCYEECDDCNTKVLKQYEDSFSNLMAFRRAIYKIKGKKNKGLIHVPGKNYTIQPNDGKKPTLYIKGSTNPLRQLGPDTFKFRFDHYEPVVDQDIYRALVKMAIDLMPSHYLPHFKKTVEWLYDKENHQFEALPSVLFGELPNEAFYNQPIMYLFFKKEGDNNTPLCTAMLYSADVAYQFVIPFADVDKGNFLYDEALAPSRQKLNKYFNIAWVRNEYFSWWDSYIWNEWNVNLKEDNVIILPDNDEIFENEKTFSNQEHALFQSKIFYPGDIAFTNISFVSGSSFLDLLNRLPSHASRVIENPSLVFNLDLASNSGSFTLSLPVSSNFGSEELKWKADFKVNKLDRLMKDCKYVTGTSFGSLSVSIFHKFLIQTHLHEIGILSLTRNNILSLIKFSSFNITTPSGSIIKTSFESLFGRDNDLELAELYTEIIGSRP